MADAARHALFYWCKRVSIKIPVDKIAVLFEFTALVGRHWEALGG
jgi:hypothetical protein